MGEDDTTNTDREQARDPFLHNFNAQTAFNAPLDGIFELNVLRALTPAECSDVRKEVQVIPDCDKHLPNLISFRDSHRTFHTVTCSLRQSRAGIFYQCQNNYLICR